jgi:SAM-dependent methyltransferase
MRRRLGGASSSGGAGFAGTGAGRSDWSARAEAYRNAPEQREGEDLDLIVRWAEGSRTALDVATGGGHVARRLREAGLQVVSADPAPGMQPDVICRAEDLPFADGAFDLVVSRIAPHHFGDIAAAVAEMARVANDLVVVEDTLYVSEEVEQAEQLRDPTHVRSYSEAEWRAMLEAAGLEIEQVEAFEKRHSLEPWLDRSATPDDDRPRVKELLAAQIEGDDYVDTKLVIKARKAA